MILARTHDMMRVAAILNHARIFPYIHEDGLKEADPIDHDGFNWLMVSDERGDLGLFMTHATKNFCHEIHTCLLPIIYGSQAKEAVRLLGNYLFNELGLLKVVTNVPEFNRRAKSFAIGNGMVHEGTNRQSHMHKGVMVDQFMYGITKEEWIQCQQ